MGSSIALHADSLRQFLYALTFYMPRVIMFILFFPVLGKGLPSFFLKSAVATVLVLYPATAFLQGVSQTNNFPQLTIMVALSEAVIGVVLGLIVSIPYFAFKAFGAYIDVYRGATFAASVTPNGDGGEELPTEELFGLLFAVLFFAGPGLMAVTNLLLESFLVIPPGYLEFGALDTMVFTLIKMIGEYLTIAFVLAGPVLVAVLVAEIIMEVISAFAQQLQVYSLQFALRSVFAFGAVLLFLEYAESEAFVLIRDYTDSLKLLFEGLV